MSVVLFTFQRSLTQTPRGRSHHRLAGNSNCPDRAIKKSFQKAHPPAVATCRATTAALHSVYSYRMAVVKAKDKKIRLPQIAPYVSIVVCRREVKDSAHHITPATSLYGGACMRPRFGSPRVACWILWEAPPSSTAPGRFSAPGDAPLDSQLPIRCNLESYILTPRCPLVYKLSTFPHDKTTLKCCFNAGAA